MIISFAFGLIGAILVLANHRPLRNTRVLIIVLILAAGLAALGIYFMNIISKETDRSLLFPMFTPLTATLLFLIARLIYMHKEKTEVILHLHGLFPVKQDERYVTGREKFITFILLLLSVVIPYSALIIIT
jgi:hypothetical protein